MSRQTQTPGVEQGDPPVPGLVTGLDDVARTLRDLRVWAGTPSYADIARTVRDVRLARGVPSHEATPGRVTVYDCFRDGRRRIDVDLVVDIAEALSSTPDVRALWRHAARSAMSPGAGQQVIPVVSTLPAAPPAVVGREDSLSALVDPGSPRLQLIRGLPGVGKTTLAVAAAHTMVTSGVVEAAAHIDLRGATHGQEVDPFAVMVGVLRVLAPGSAVPSTPRAQRTAYQELLSSRPVVLVWDDIASWERIEPLLPMDATTRVIATSRWSHTLPRSAGEVVLEGLTDDGAAGLLREATGRRVAADHPAIHDLLGLTGRLPLALSLVGQRIADRPDWSWEDHVDSYRARLELLQLEDDVQDTLAVTYAELPETDRLVLRRVALHPTSQVGTDTARALTGLEADTCDVAIGHLQRAHLLGATDTGHWTMHNLVQVFGQRMALRDERPAAREAAVERMVKCYLESGAAAVAALHPPAPNDWYWWQQTVPQTWPRDEATRWLHRELTNVLALATWLVDHHRSVHAARLSAVLSMHLWESGHMAQTLALHQSARAAAVTLPDTHGEALAERNLGMTHLRISRYPQARAHLERARDLYRAIGYVNGQMAATSNLAVVALLTGDYDQALRLTEETSRHYRAHGKIDHLLSALSNMAMIKTRTGKSAEAVALLQESIQLAVEHDRPGMERIAQVNLSDLLADSGTPADAERAMEAADRAIVLAERLGHDRGRAYARISLAKATHRTGNTPRAKQLALRALEDAQALTAPDMLASVHNNLGEMCLHQHEHEEAREHFATAWATAEEIGEAFECERAAQGLATLAEARAEQV